MQVSANISEMGFRTANKVGMQMRCASTARDEGSARRLIDDSLFLTLQLLDRLDPVTFREGYEFHFATLQKSIETSNFAAQDWQTFLVNKCEGLRVSGIQEKLIAELGTGMGKWDFSCVPFDSLGQAMNQLACLSSVDSNQVVNFVLKQDVLNQTTGTNYASAVSNAVGGLALLIESIETAITPIEKLAVAAISCFAGNLLVENVKLFN